MNGQVGATGAVGGENGKGGREEGREEGKMGERGLVEVKNSWMLWCWRMWQGRAVRHLGAGCRDTGQQGVNKKKSTTVKNYIKRCSDLGRKHWCTEELTFPPEGF